MERTATLGTLGVVLAALSLLTGCRGIPTWSEVQSRADLKALTQVYRPGERRATSPPLDAEATLADFLTYAMLNQPRVEAAYYDYAAAVERITVERSLPDPRLTFELDLQEIVTTILPGLMTDLPWLEKLRIRADAASAETQARYFAFETVVLQTAFGVKRPYFEVCALTDRLRIYHETVTLLRQVQQLARTRVETGKSTLQDVFRAEIEQARLETETANLEDSRHSLQTQLKAALGLGANQPDPPWPTRFESTPVDLSPDRLLTDALSRNPRLKTMAAEVRRAESEIRLARSGAAPDFALGIGIDAKASPLMTRPSMGITLPLWRDKIAAGIASAQASRNAAQARLSAEQIQLAVDLAEKSFLYRESTRNLQLLAGTLLPKARQALEIARSGYSSGTVNFIDLLDAERTLLDFQLAEVQARTQRELALAEVSLLILGVPPEGAPVLPASDPSR